MILGFVIVVGVGLYFMARFDSTQNYVEAKFDLKESMWYSLTVLLQGIHLSILIKSSRGHANLLIWNHHLHIGLFMPLDYQTEIFMCFWGLVGLTYIWSQNARLHIIVNSIT